MPSAPSPSTISGWHRAIRRSGVAQVQIRTLLGHYGVKRRTSAAIQRIRAELARLDPPIFVDGIGDPAFGEDIPLSSSAALAYHDLGRRGPLWTATEFEFKQKNLARLLDFLGLCSQPGQYLPEYSPAGTKDKLDCLAHEPGAEGAAVAVEIKRHDGERRGIEQLLRYVQHLEDEDRASARGVLITGLADIHTWKALQRLDRRQRVRWYVYQLPAGNPRGEVVSVREVLVPRERGESRR